MSLYCKKPFENSLYRDMFNGSDMDCCMTDLTSKGVNKYVQNVSMDRNMFSMLNKDYCMAEVSSEGVLFIECSRSSTFWQEIYSEGQIWTTVWLI
jgi:hypothetical protein